MRVFKVIYIISATTVDEGNKNITDCGSRQTLYFNQYISYLYRDGKRAATKATTTRGQKGPSIDRNVL